MDIKVFYNEIDPYCCAWLSNLMDKGHIRPGVICDKSIVDLTPDDVRPYDLAHFFAGIAGWDYALTLAGWRFDGRVTWTGSCPCQPFSQAGQRKGFDDARHLWPVWSRLIGERRPAIVLGEQVEAAIGWGWLDLVFADLEGQGYACGAAILPACGVGAPHIRQRLWFVADSDGGDASAEGLQRGGEQRQFAENGSPLLMSDANGSRQRPRGTSEAGNGSDAPRLEPARLCASGELADTLQPGRPEGRPLTGRRSATGLRFTGEYTDHALLALGVADSEREAEARGLPGWPSTERQRSPWAEAEWLECRDGKRRPVEPGTFPLATGLSGRMGRLRAFGNAIVPQAAAEFIGAYLDAVGRDFLT